MLKELEKYASLAYAKKPTIQNTYDLAKKAIDNKIEGDFVECGVAAGSQIGVMGHVCRQTNSDKKIWAYDSYQGIPLAGPNDDDQPGIGPIDPNREIPEDLRELLVTSGISAHSLPQVKNNLINWGVGLTNYVFVEGWFQDTVMKTFPEKISLLRLDGDLYESTKVCLDHLHSKVVKGGYVIIDDYALTGARQAFKDFIYENNLDYEPIPVDPNIPEAHWYQII